jgi:hypothetical protein
MGPNLKINRLLIKLYRFLLAFCSVNVIEIESFVEAIIVKLSLILESYYYGRTRSGYYQVV